MFIKFAKSVRPTDVGKHHVGIFSASPPKLEGFAWIHSKMAFTLAEILITLGIIGIIASMTIPALVLNTQKQEYMIQLKKDYSIFSQALLKLETEMGCTGDLLCAGYFATGTTSQTIGDAMVPYYNVIQNCQMDTQGCMTDSRSLYYNGAGTRSSTLNTNSAAYKFITADGSSIYIADTANDCSSNFGPNSMGQVCGYVIFDINGLKGPNNFGRDIFQFYITSNSMLYPYGGKLHNISGTSYYWKDQGACVPATASSITGNYCTGRVVDESWQMNY